MSRKRNEQLEASNPDRNEMERRDLFESNETLQDSNQSRFGHIEKYINQPEKVTQA
jgi:hypothetical protein